MAGKREILHEKDEFEAAVESFLKQNDFIVSSSYHCENRAYLENQKDKKNSRKNKTYFYVDQTNSKVAIINMLGKRIILSFDDITGCELVVDDLNQDVAGRTLLGGAVAGNVGATIGGLTAQNNVSSYKIVIYTKNISDPKVEIVLLNEKTYKKSPFYKSADDFAKNVSAVVKAILNS